MTTSNHCRCDADPSALARYVLALLKKDKPIRELTQCMLEQLDVFLGAGKFSIDPVTLALTQRYPSWIASKISPPNGCILFSETKPFLDKLIAVIKSEEYIKAQSPGVNPTPAVPASQAIVPAPPSLDPSKPVKGPRECTPPLDVSPTFHFPLNYRLCFLL